MTVWFDRPEPQDGQAVYVAVRAGESPQDVQMQPWSPWHQIESSGSSVVITDDLHGEYVQHALRIYPSNDDMCTVCPEIKQIKYTTGRPDSGSDSAYLPAQIDVDGYAPPNGCLYSNILVQHAASHDLESTVMVYEGADDEDFRSCIFVYDKHLLPANILAQRSDYLYLPSNANLVAHTDSHEMASSINVIRNDIYLPSQINIPSFENFKAQIDVTYAGATANILVQRPANEGFRSNIFIVPEYPSMPVPLSVDISPQIWSSNPFRRFSWGSSNYVTSPVVGYVWMVTRSPSSTANSQWFAGLDSHEALVDLRDFGSGQLYFHVAAINSNGYYGPTNHIGARYNIPPTPPGQDHMQINSMDMYSASVPLVAQAPASPHAITWSPSFVALDQATLRYEIQIATHYGFGIDPNTLSNSIVRTVENHAETSLILVPNLESGNYVCRIRAWDGRQYSEYSPIGAFAVNHRPHPPEGLSVRQEK